MAWSRAEVWTISDAKAIVEPISPRVENRTQALGLAASLELAAMDFQAEEPLTDLVLDYVSVASGMKSVRPMPESVVEYLGGLGSRIECLRVSALLNGILDAFREGNPRVMAMREEYAERMDVELR